MQTLIDLYELSEPVIETYRSYASGPRDTPAPSSVSSIDLDVDDDARAPARRASERSLRARLWSSED